MSGRARTPGQLLADQIVERDARLRAEEIGAVQDAKAWLDLHSVDPTDAFAKGPAGGAGKRSGSDGTPIVDKYAAFEYARLRHWSDVTARHYLLDVTDLEHRFPTLWAAMLAAQIPVWQARKIAAACRELSKSAAALVDAELARKAPMLPWGRIMRVLGAAILRADPALAEAKRQAAKQARYVAMGRSEDGLKTMIVRAEAGDLIMVYALVDRLADILRLEGSTETADQRRATAFGLLAQPAEVLVMLLRHTDDNSTATTPAPDNEAAATENAKPDSGEPAAAPHGSDGKSQGSDDDELPPDLFHEREPHSTADTGPLDEVAEPPPWTAEDYDEPDPPADERPHQRRYRPPDPDPADPFGSGNPTTPGEPPGPPDGSGLRLGPPGLAELLTPRNLRAIRPRAVFHVYLTDHTLATGNGVVRTDWGPILATQLREFLGKHSCQISLRPVLDVDQVPAVDAYDIPDQIREAVRARQIASIYPDSTATSRNLDLDHINPHRADGSPKQTAPDNLGPLARREHNSKTHGRWTVKTPHPGVYLWRSPHGYHYLVTNQGTQHLGRPPDDREQ